MEILITVPPWLVAYWESAVEGGLMANEFITRHSNAVWSFLRNQRNAFFVVVSMVLFWPFYAYCIVAVTTASTWIFWLFASVLMGIVQMIYVSYQFVMIAIDIFVLTLLKTYQVIMRSRAAQVVFFFSERIHKSRQKLSRRREWRKQCEGAREYADFLTIPILESVSTITYSCDGTKASNQHDGPVGKNKENKLDRDRKKDSATMVRGRRTGYNAPSSSRNGMPHRKCYSFGNMDMLKEELNEIDEDQDDSNASVPSNLLKRRPSLPQLTSLRDAARQTTEDQGIGQDLGPSTAQLLLSTTARLKEERSKLRKGRESGLEFLLSGVVKRNHLALEDAMVNNARSVAVSGQYEFSPSTRKAIAAYYDEVEKGLQALTDGDAPATCETTAMLIAELQDRMRFLRKMKQNVGRTALMLSGGGAQAMYHLGTVRALIQSNLYDDIKVISGTSGGSIAAACCAMYTAKEIERDICVPTVSTDFRLNGEMKRKNIRWFPPMADMISYWFKHRLLVDSEVSN
jgi:Patatin-like phospholipase